MVCLTVFSFGLYLTLPYRDECDSGGIGSLNRDAFVKGMWRIDEELRKAQLSVIRGSPSLRQPKRAVTLLR